MVKNKAIKGITKEQLREKYGIKDNFIEIDNSRIKSENRDLIIGIIGLILLIIPMIILFYLELYNLNNKGYWIYYWFSFNPFKIKQYKFYYNKYPFGNNNNSYLFNWILLYFQFLCYLVFLLQLVLIPILLILLIYEYKNKSEVDE